MARTKLTSMQRSFASLRHLAETSKQICVPLSQSPFDLLSSPIQHCQSGIVAAPNASEPCTSPQSRDAPDAKKYSSCLPTSSRGPTCPSDFLQRDGSSSPRLLQSSSSFSSSSSSPSSFSSPFSSSSSSPSSSSSSPFFSSFSSSHSALPRASSPSPLLRTFASSPPQAFGSRHIHLTPDSSRDTEANSGGELQPRTVAEELLSLQADQRVIRPLYRALSHAIRSLRKEFERFGTNNLLSPGDVGWLYDNAQGCLSIIQYGDVAELENYLRNRFCEALPSSRHGDYVSMQLELGRRLDKGFRALALISRRLSLLQLHAPEPNSECLTDGIRVITQCWFDNRTDPRVGALFHYKIIIRNESHSEPVQLVSRAWTITDFDGEATSVIGPGVTGMYPILHPGEQFEYSSFSGLKSKRGTQQGTFTMIGMNSKRLFEVNIAPFALIP